MQYRVSIDLKYLKNDLLNSLVDLLCESDTTFDDDDCFSISKYEIFLHSVFKLICYIDDLNEIDMALKELKLNPSMFGICKCCGKPIEYRRFRRKPWLRLCIRCQNMLMK